MVAAFMVDIYRFTSLNQQANLMLKYRQIILGNIRRLSVII